MTHGGITNQICLGLAGALAIGWCCLRAVRRGDGVVGIVFRGLLSLALVGGLMFFVAGKLENFSGDFATDAVSILTIVAAVAVAGVLLSVFWAPLIADLVAAPLANIFDGGHEPPEMKPAYSSAKFQREAGDVDKAIEAVRAELKKFPNDFEGVMLLAEIQARDADDLSGATVTLEEFIHAPGVPARQAVTARMKLVEWQLGREDVAAAGRELKQITVQFPGTEFALRAEQQLAQLTKNSSSSSEEFSAAPKIEPGKLAAAYVKLLQLEPGDVAVREKLALIYARDFKRLDLATMEFEQLINSPGHSPKQTARWLKLLAKMQIELNAPVVIVEATFQQIVTRFPDHPESQAAREKLAQFRSQSTNSRRSS
jgi:TolA-binding protein